MNLSSSEPDPAIGFVILSLVEFCFGLFAVSTPSDFLLFALLQLCSCSNDLLLLPEQQCQNLTLYQIHIYNFAIC